MKKLYAGVAAAALAATGIACTAGAASASSPWPSSLGFVPNNAVSTALSSAGDQLYTATIDAADQTTIDVAVTTIATGASVHHQVTLTPTVGDSIMEIDALAVTSTGTVVAGADQQSGDIGIWTAPVAADTATESASGLTTGVNVLAVSADGTRGVFGGGNAITAFTLGNDAVTQVSNATTLDTSTPSADAAVKNLAIGDDGTIEAVGDDYPTGDYNSPAPTRWSVDSVGAVSPQTLGDEPTSLAMAGTKVVVGEVSSDYSTFTVEVFDGSGKTSVVVPSEADIVAVSPDNSTFWATDRYGVERLDLNALGSYSDSNPVPESNLATDGIFGLLGTSDAFYSVGSTSDANGNWGDATVSRLTKPGEITDAVQQVYDDGSIDLQWTAPADNGGADPSYVVTAIDRAAPHAVITATVTDTYDYLDSSAGIQQGHTYDVAVRAENAAFAGNAVIVPPVLSGSATVTLTGSAVVGGTLTATVSKSTFPATAKLSYQWGYSGGQFGGPIEGATKSTFSPTADLVGMQVLVRVTASLEGYSPASVSSNPLLVKAAHPASPKPVQVTKVTVKPMKASSKKLTVTVPGVSSAPGKVKVYDGKKLIGTAKIKGGKVVVKLKKHLAKGKHKVTLKYAGSAKVGKFTKTVKVKVK